ncbi:MAG: GNAT family N-acetyltransferase [Clostridia bacterium]|nr:GNAT family N-acetyltransferase [Clostridia bacterium]
MEISLKKASIDDAELIWRMQIAAFKPLLDKYQDYDYSPAAETIDRTIQRLQSERTDYYLILADATPIGAVRLIRLEGNRCRISPVFILPEYQGRRIAQTAMKQLESLYPNASGWELHTILQEDKLRHFYEKLGYRRGEHLQPVKEGMDLVLYEK